MNTKANAESKTIAVDQTAIKAQYQNGVRDMTTAEPQGDLSIADGIRGRIVSFQEKDAKALSPDALRAKAAEFQDAAKHPNDIPKWMGGMIGEARKSIPDLNRAQGGTILRAYATDFEHAASAVEARKSENYVQFTHPDGTRERGIVSDNGPSFHRQGLWMAEDKDGRVRQFASFKDGKADGTVLNLREDGTLESQVYMKEGKPYGKASRYNEKGERIHEVTFNQDGEIASAKEIDPAAAKAEKQERREQAAVMSSLRIGR